MERHERGQRAIDTFLNAEFTGLRTKRVLLDGDPAREIIDDAHEEHCDLIFMPTHGHGPFRRLLLGSVTAKVLHDADCPVWTGVHMEPPPQHTPGVLERVVCAVDLGKNSEKVLGWAARIATEFHASLTVVHAGELARTADGGLQLFSGVAQVCARPGRGGYYQTTADGGQRRRRVRADGRGHGSNLRGSVAAGGGPAGDRPRLARRHSRPADRHAYAIIRALAVPGGQCVRRRKRLPCTGPPYVSGKPPAICLPSS